MIIHLQTLLIKIPNLINNNGALIFLSEDIANMINTTPTPQDDNNCGWFHLSKPRQPNANHQGKTVARFTIIGAGVAGLACARRLAYAFPDNEIVLIDAQTIGFGASGRNSGFMIDLPHDITAPDYIGDLSIAKINQQINLLAIDQLEKIIKQQDIACDLRHSGKYQAAVTVKGLKILDSYSRGLEKMGEEFEIIAGDDLQAHLGTPFYKKAIYTKGSRLVQPAALVKGLADCLPNNVKLYENTPIIAYEKGAKITLKTANSTIITNTLILTTNCFVSQFGFLKNRIIPVFTYAGLTRPLTTHEQMLLGGKHTWGIIPANPNGTTLRRTVDNRLLVRNTVTFNPNAMPRQNMMEKAIIHIKHSFQNRFAMLNDVNFDYFWGGGIAITRNQKSFFGNLDKNIYAVAGCNGLGLTKATGLGTLLADHIAGKKSDIIDFLLHSEGPSNNPPEPFLSLGANMLLWWGRKAAGLEC